MYRIWCDRVQGRAPLRAQAVRAWPLLQLPGRLVAFVVVVVLADAVAIVFAGRAAVTAGAATLRPRDLVIFGLLTLCSAVTVEMTRRSGETALMIKDVFGVWELPMAILLPPVFALLAPIPRIVLTQWRVRKIAVHRRVFTAAAYSLSYGSVYLAFHELNRIGSLSLTGAGIGAAVWLVAVAACFVLYWVVHNCMIMTAIKGSDPSATIRDTLMASESIHSDVTEISVAIVLTLGIAISPVVIVFAMPFVTLLQRSSRHSQLVDASRLDAKTGLLNATTWRRESSAEVARALRTESPVAVALIDIDHFKAVNDIYGHLAGDDALRDLSNLLKLVVREYDLVGRFGGEEFALLLPQTDEAGARNIAERIRAQTADLRIDVPGALATEPIRLTVSIGVAVLGGGGQQLTELLAAADVALYRAKGAGRNQVWVTTDTASAGVAGHAVDR